MGCGGEGIIQINELNGEVIHLTASASFKVLWCTKLQFPRGYNSTFDFLFVQRKNSIGFHLTSHPVVGFMPQLRKPKWKLTLSAVCIYISLNLLLLPDSYKNPPHILSPQGLLSAQNQGPLLGKATVLTFLHFAITLREGWKKIYLKTCSIITSRAFQISP